MSKESDKERIERLKGIVLAMQELPGSYQFYDESGTVIYVGKAKNLKRRVSSYLHKEVDRFKTKVLVSKIHDIKYTYVETEEDALHLENSLIKKYNPRYNILLKDGKTYPSIVITNEEFPRIIVTRQINKRMGTYFGPYSHLGSMYTILDFIKKLYHPRSCRQPISTKGIAECKYKACLEYHMKNCGGLCIGKQSYDEYQENIRKAREILRGNTRELSRKVYDDMMQAAEELRFEDAERLKQQYLLIDQFCAKSEVVSYTIANVDVFTVDSGVEGDAYVNYMHVKNGAVNQSITFEVKRKLDETDAEVLLEVIPEIRERFRSTAKEVIVPFEMEWELPDAHFFTPQKGDKHHLLELSQMNCKQYRFDRLKQSEKLNPEQKSVRLMKELQEKLGLKKLPYHIEAFDNSNISGTDAVAGCVVFKAMKPSKKDYRKYNIKTVVGPDDYASMQEVVRRRYAALSTIPNNYEGTPYGHETEEKAASTDQVEMPDLIVCDGGLGQMHCVQEVVEGELGLEIPIAGLAKDDRHRTNELLFLKPVEGTEYRLPDGRTTMRKECVTVQLKTTDELFLVLTRLQDEVHRYAITFHRDKRSKRALHSELDDIKGIGSATKEKLLKQFKTVKRIREAAEEDLTACIGTAKARVISEYFNQNA